MVDWRVRRKLDGSIVEDDLDILLIIEANAVVKADKLTPFEIP